MENMDIHMTMDNALFTSLYILNMCVVPLCLKPDVRGNSVSQQKVFVTDRFHTIFIKRKEGSW